MMERHRLFAALLTPLLLCSVSYELQAQAELTVRLLPGGDDQQLRETLQLLATVSQREVYEATHEVSPADVVRERCGTATSELIDLFKQESPRLRVGHLKKGDTIEVPACPRWYFDKTVEIQQNTTAWDVAVRYLGSGGKRALAQLRDANEGVAIDELVPGQELNVPYVSLPVSFRLKEEFEDRAEEIVTRFRSNRSNGVGGLRVLEVHVAAPLRPIAPLGQEDDSEVIPIPDSVREPDPSQGFTTSPRASSRVSGQSRRVGWSWAGRSIAVGREPGVSAREVEVSFETQVAGGLSSEREAQHDATLVEVGPAGGLSDEPEEASTSGLPTEEGPRSAAGSSHDVPEPPIKRSNPCSEARGLSNWPFDAAALEAVLRANRQRSHRRIDPTVVAIVDTGIEASETGVSDLAQRHELHPLDSPRFSFSYSERELRGRRFWDDDSNLFEDDIVGTNLVTQRGFPDLEADSAYSLGDHGIGVAGLVLGGYGSASLRELARERIALKILNPVAKVVLVKDGGHEVSWRIDRAALSTGLLYAGDAARIANYSLTEGGTLQETFKNNFSTARNLLLITAAGNEPRNLNVEPLYPMALGGPSSPRAITVAAHDPEGNLLGHSSWGNLYVDLTAPGCAIESSSFQGELKTYDGTSFAAPLVTFTAALLAAEGLFNPQEIKHRILSTVDVDPRLEDFVGSAGRLNVVKALSLYDDIVVFEGRKQMLRGRIRRPETLKICGRQMSVAELNQVVFDYAKLGERRTRVTFFNSLGHLFYVFCGERPEESLEIETHTGRVETIPLERIAEIVPAMLTES